jgi:predicted MarR family transcription regulator
LSGNKGDLYENNYGKSFCGKNIYHWVVRCLVAASEQFSKCHRTASGNYISI